MQPDTSLTVQIAEWAVKEPARQAIVSSDYSYSYGDIYAMAVKESLRIKSLGLPDGTLIGIHCARELNHLVLTLAAAYAGLPSITIPTFEKASFLDQLNELFRSIFVINDHQCEINLISKRLGPRDYDAGSLVFDTPIYFATSGSTGLPKIVKHSTVTIAQQAPRHIPDSNQRFLCLATVEHNFSKRHRLYCFSQGATNIFVNSGVKGLVEECGRLSVSVMHLTGYQARELLKQKNVSQLNSIRLKLGGSHIDPELRNKIRKNITTDIQFGYGTTETGAIAFTDPEDKKSGLSVGKALPGIGIKIVSQDKNELDVGEVGEIAIKGDGLFLAYEGLDQVYASQVNKGWFYTKDVGYLDNEGRVQVTGRLDNMFIFNSMNIFPEEIESKLLAYDELEDVAVVPRLSKAHESIPIALVVFKNQSRFNTKKLQRFSQKVNGIRSPRHFIVVDEIPRNRAGKMARVEAGLLSMEVGNVKSKLCELIRAQPSLSKKFGSQLDLFGKGIQDIDLEDLELDSLERMDMLVALELKFDVVIKPDELTVYRYLGDVVNRILNPKLEKKDDGTLQAENLISDIDEFKRNDKTDRMVYVLNRAIKGCRTLTDLNRVLAILERKITPEEFVALWVYNVEGELLPAQVEKGYRKVVEEWLQIGAAHFKSSGKTSFERYKKERLGSALTFFQGPGSKSEKTLIIGFSGRGDSCLDIPNYILLQHAEARHYDFLIISEPRGRGYLAGIPFWGGSETQVVEAVANLDLIQGYKNTRIAGVSAGAYPAMLLGYELGADLTLSLAGRFHRFKRNPGFVLNRIVGAIAVRIQKPYHKVIYCYSSSRKDKRYAIFMSHLTNGETRCVRYPGVDLGHRLLYNMLGAGRLSSFLEDTLFKKKTIVRDKRTTKSV